MTHHEGTKDTKGQRFVGVRRARRAQTSRFLNNSGSEGHGRESVPLRKRNYFRNEIGKALFSALHWRKLSTLLSPLSRCRRF